MKNKTISETDRGYLVVHPLDDAPEIKRTGEGLGLMEMTWSAKVSLMALQGYLVLMAALVFYHVMKLAGAL